jgi:hypothetical protein
MAAMMICCIILATYYISHYASSLLLAPWLASHNKPSQKREEYDPCLLLASCYLGNWVLLVPPQQSANQTVRNIRYTTWHISYGLSLIAREAGQEYCLVVAWHHKKI